MDYLVWVKSMQNKYFNTDMIREYFKKEGKNKQQLRTGRTTKASQK